MTVTECRSPQFIRRIDGLRRIQTLRRVCGGYFHPPVSRRCLSRSTPMSIHDSTNASPGRGLPRSHRCGRYRLPEGGERGRLDGGLFGHVAPARGDSSRPSGKPGTIPNRERGTLSPAPCPSKAPRRFPPCSLQVVSGEGRVPRLDTGPGVGYGEANQAESLSRRLGFRSSLPGELREQLQEQLSAIRSL